MRDFHFSIDRGGTFTDVFAEVPDGSGGSKFRALKLLSEDPANYADAPREGIRRILQEVTGVPHPRDGSLDTSRLGSIRMGTTVATNALLERKGERTALVVTAGFPDLLHIANQSRPNIFDLKIRTPDSLYERVIEVDEQVILPLGNNPDQRNGRHAADNEKLYPPSGPILTVSTGEQVCVRKAPDLSIVRRDLQSLLDAGISSIAVVLKHSAIFPDHERRVGEVAREMGFKQISLSSVVMPMVKMVPRGFTAAADAYLTPHIMKYIQTFQSGFDSRLSEVQVLFMQSDGGLSSVERFSGHKAILSGPAGGYVGYALTTRWEGQDPSQLQVIGFDMGGTSTDVSRFAGTYEHVFETTTAGVTIQAPQLDINTVAAGGGSRLFFRNGLFVVGPESAAAHPGPVCYKKGGYLAITDANLALGRVLPEFFPKIFGPKENEPLDAAGTAAAFSALAEEVNAYEAGQGKPPKSVDEIAMGFITVANETMCRPIRALTTMKGYDASAHVLACFGGAGGQHACAIAKSLGMRTIFVHRFAGILSAVGIHLADIVQEAQEPCASSLTREEGAAAGQVLGQLEERLDRLEAGVREQLQHQGFAEAQIRVERYLNLRYRGTDVAVMTPRPSDGDYVAAFEKAYTREFGFKLDRPLIVDDVRVRGTGTSRPLPSQEGKGEVPTPGPLPAPVVLMSAYFEVGGRQSTPVYELSTLSPHHRLPGPAILIDSISTIVVEPGWAATVTADHNVRMDAEPPAPAPASVTDTSASVTDAAASVTDVAAGADGGVPCDPIQLAIFSHRFMGIAEQMGRTLQRTSISVNIKERLDFSCALFGPDGSLVANAPHLPVHLGAMSEAVRFQVRYYTEGPGKEQGLSEGDVLLSNHPQLAGGSHLPDITAITPVFSGGRIVFFVASRGHHADIGGISPGSMPPHSKLLVEEGAAIVSFKVVDKGVFQEEALSKLLLAPGELATSIPNMSGTRNLSDNLSDIRAQVAANTRGIQLVADLIAEYGLPVVQLMMSLAHSTHAQACTHDAHTCVQVPDRLHLPLRLSIPLQLPCGCLSSWSRTPSTSNVLLLSTSLWCAQGVSAQQYKQHVTSQYPLLAYMEHIQRNAEAAVREMLTAFSLSRGLPECGTVHADDHMDDGTRIALSVTIDRRDGSAVFDFEGTGPEVYGNCNAPPAVAYSAIIYAMRCMVTRDIPLNQGCLAPITVRIPPACLLNPSPEAAVVGGNVLTSQRVTDVVLKAFLAASASQGCMNNLTFGDEGMGYYETIAGGAGAGPGWHGRSGVHTHMTNTRITDPEILERRYPVVLRCFKLRPGSGGAGRWRGGDGVVRELEALRPLDTGILSERRSLRPFGLEGGGSALPGLNLLIRANGRVVNLGGKATVRLNAGDRLQINTPGGGGFGDPDSTCMHAAGEGQGQGSMPLEQRGSVHEYRRLQETA